MLAVDRVVRRRLERAEEVLPVGDLRDVDRRDELRRDQAVGGVAGRRDDVVAAARAHRGDHLVRAAGVLERRLAAGLRLVALDPRGLAVALPGDGLERALARCRSRAGARRSSPCRPSPMPSARALPRAPRRARISSSLCLRLRRRPAPSPMAKVCRGCHVSRTARPCAPSASIEVVSRFCSSTTTLPAPSIATR